jgi:DNA end-binding protein Ku
VQLYPATTSKERVAFHLLNRETGNRLRRRLVDPETNEEVDAAGQVKGYQVAKNEYIVMEEDEIDSVAIESSHTIDIETFVPLEDLDPIYFDHPYFLVPAGDSEGTLRAYRLLERTMDASGRVAIGRFVMRTKEYLTAIRARDGALELTTMLFHDEVRPTKPIPTGGKKPTKTQLDNAVAIIEELATDWEPERYTDCYRERLENVIERKRKRQTIEVPKAEAEPAPVDDLMAALKASLDNVKAGRDARFTKEKEKEKAKA